MERASGWHATSEHEATAIRELGFSQPICISPNGVTLPTPIQIEKAKQFWQAKVPSLNERRVALFYGRFHEKKRPLECIDIWRQENPKGWVLLMVGIPEQYTIEELRGYVRDQQAQDDILVFNGEGCPSPCAAADLFLFPSHSENFGMVVAEALAHGVPPIVAQGSPWAKLNELNTGWFVEWQNFPKTLSKVCRLPDSERRNRGAAGIRWMREEFNWEAAAEKLTSFYRTLPASS